MYHHRNKCTTIATNVPRQHGWSMMGRAEKFLTLSGGLASPASLPQASWKWRWRQSNDAHHQQHHDTIVFPTRFWLWKYSIQILWQPVTFFFRKKQPKFGQNGCSEENAVVIMKMIVRWCWDSGEMVETSKAESWYPNVPPVQQVATPQFP